MAEKYKSFKKNEWLYPWMFWTPIVFLLLLFVLRKFNWDFFVNLFAADVRGFYFWSFETWTVLFAFISGVLSIRLFKNCQYFRNFKVFGYFFLIVALGSFFVAAEELSWGQWIFKWESPESIAVINEQRETNFHNVFGLSKIINYSYFVISIGMVFIGGFLPLLRFLRGQFLTKKDGWRYWFLPRFTFLPISIYLFVAKWIHWMWFRESGSWDVSHYRELIEIGFFFVGQYEFAEFGFISFLLMYLIFVTLQMRILKRENFV